MKYIIDVPTYHWDNDHFETEIRRLGFDSLEDAQEAQAFLRGLEFKDDDLLHHWSFSDTFRRKRTNSVKQGWDAHPLIERLDLWHGVIVEAEFNIYYPERVYVGDVR